MFAGNTDTKRNIRRYAPAFLVLGESHISVHTYPEDNAYYFDVFSCKDFNANEVVKILISTFGNHDMDYEFLER